MKTIFRLVVLAVGFLSGIYVGVHYPKQAENIDQLIEARNLVQALTLR